MKTALLTISLLLGLAQISFAKKSPPPALPPSPAAAEPATAPTAPAVAENKAAPADGNLLNCSLLPNEPLSNCLPSRINLPTPASEGGTSVEAGGVKHTEAVQLNLPAPQGNARNATTPAAQPEAPHSPSSNDGK